MSPPAVLPVKEILPPFGKAIGYIEASSLAKPAQLSAVEGTRYVPPITSSLESKTGKSIAPPNSPVKTTSSSSVFAPAFVRAKKSSPLLK